MTNKAGIILETSRLLVFPLSYSQLLKYVQADNSLETELKLTPAARVIPAELLEPLQQNILPSVADPAKNYLYFTLWVIILKKENRMVADLCFKGEPNADGETEIGYGTYGEFQNNGYMTEAISAIIRWVASRPEIRAIIAETDKTNIPSVRTLQKNGFMQFKVTENMIWWRHELK